MIKMYFCVILDEVGQTCGLNAASSLFAALFGVSQKPHHSHHLLPPPPSGAFQTPCHTIPVSALEKEKKNSVAGRKKNPTAPTIAS